MHPTGWILADGSPFDLEGTEILQKAARLGVPYRVALREDNRTLWFIDLIGVREQWEPTFSVRLAGGAID